MGKDVYTIGTFMYRREEDENQLVFRVYIDGEAKRTSLQANKHGIRLLGDIWFDDPKEVELCAVLIKELIEKYNGLGKVSDVENGTVTKDA